MAGLIPPPRYPGARRGIGAATLLAVRRFAEHDGLTAAAAISYYALFSLFPLLLVALAAAAFVLPDLPARRQVLYLVETYTPGARLLIQENLTRLVEIRSGVGLVGLIFLAWSGSAVFAAITRALDRAVGAGSRPSPLRARLVGLAMVAATAAVLITALAGATWLAALRRRGVTWPWPPAGDLDVMAQVVAGALTFGAILALYRWVPAGAPPVRRLWSGALLATAGLHVARTLFAGYVSAINAGVVVYGSIGVVILTLLWFFVSAAILIFGLEWAVALNGPPGEAGTARGPGSPSQWTVGRGSISERRRGSRWSR